MPGLAGTVTEDLLARVLSGVPGGILPARPVPVIGSFARSGVPGTGLRVRGVVLAGVDGGAVAARVV